MMDEYGKEGQDEGGHCAVVIVVIPKQADVSFEVDCSVAERMD